MLSFVTFGGLQVKRWRIRGSLDTPRETVTQNLNFFTLIKPVGHFGKRSISWSQLSGVTRFSVRRVGYLGISEVSNQLREHLMRASSRLRCRFWNVLDLSTSMLSQQWATTSRTHCSMPSLKSTKVISTRCYCTTWSLFLCISAWFSETAWVSAAWLPICTTLQTSLDALSNSRPQWTYPILLWQFLLSWSAHGSGHDYLFCPS